MPPERRPNFRIQAAANSAVIFMYDDIGPSWMGMIGAKWLADELKALGEIEEMTVRINSAGGDVFEGLAIYNALVNHKAKVCVEVDGLAASIASIIAMAGDEIKIAENAMLMIHNPYTWARGESADFRKVADTLDQVKDSLVGIYAARSGQKAEDIAKWMDDETWLNGAEAKEKGLASEVLPNKGVTASVDTRIHNFKRMPAELVASSSAVQQAKLAMARRRLDLIEMES